MLLGNRVWDIVSPSAQNYQSALYEWRCRISHKKSDSRPERKWDEERVRNWNRDRTKEIYCRDKGGKRWKREKNSMCKKEIFIPVKTSCVILILWFSSSILETTSGLPTARLWSKQRTSEPFQHASLSITLILSGNLSSSQVKKISTSIPPLVQKKKVAS